MQDLLNAATLGSIYLLFTLGMALAWGTIGILNFAHGATFMFSAFVAHVLSRETPLPFLAAVAISVVVGALMSVATQVLAFQQIIKRAKSQHHAELRILIGGIGVAAIPLAIAQRETKSSPFGINSDYTATVFEFAGLRLSSTALVILIAGLGIGIGLTVWLRRSRQGLALRALGVDAETSAGMGVNRQVMAIGTMAVAGALAGLAGALLTFHLSAIAPETGDQLIIKAFAIVVLGGLGSMAGAVIGSYVLAGTETLVLVAGHGTWVDAVSFGLIFLILLVRPQGLLGRKEVRRT
ncbi:MAG TPA: branched-chain amino acid ABC transporter permease [Nocardioides sp.]|jgi:branched-chain amino acid transport system permease protein|uniref:branched-chain amino acid ABC transporter permease n=1 Tax=Nocardioides sp. TaxID=35761 RepID=UPI002BADB569|nr:branched-chain amino acid ABC transporter permease [Nocardioides sp.]HTW18277.1 branched-chain amino acid ABC transporter permease [Nocardioides sp.]